MAADKIVNAVNKYDQDLHHAMHDYTEMVNVIIPEGQEGDVPVREKESWLKAGKALLHACNELNSAKAQTTYHVPVTPTPAQAHSYRVHS